MPLVIETARCILRPLDETDVSGMFQLDSNAEVLQYLGGKTIANPEQSLAIIKMVRNQYEVNGYGRWAVIKKSSGEFIGWAGLKLVEGEAYLAQPHTDLGYRLLPQFWGRGYGTELAMACCKWGFEALNLESIYAATHQENQGSQKILAKCGFQKMGTFLYEEAPQFWYVLSRNRWKANEHS